MYLQYLDFFRVFTSVTFIYFWFYVHFYYQRMEVTESIMEMPFHENCGDLDTNVSDIGKKMVRVEIFLQRLTN